MKPIPFAWFLANEGISIRLVGDRIAFTPRDIKPEIVEFIRANRNAIIAELSGAPIPATEPPCPGVQTARPTREAASKRNAVDAFTEALRGKYA